MPCDCDGDHSINQAKEELAEFLSDEINKMVEGDYQLVPSEETDPVLDNPVIVNRDTLHELAANAGQKEYLVNVLIDGSEYDYNENDRTELMQSSNKVLRGLTRYPEQKEQKKSTDYSAMRGGSANLNGTKSDSEFPTLDIGKRAMEDSE